MIVPRVATVLSVLTVPGVVIVPSVATVPSAPIAPGVATVLSVLIVLSVPIVLGVATVLRVRSYQVYLSLLDKCYNARFFPFFRRVIFILQIG